MKLRERLQTRRKSDKADAIFVMSVLFVPFLFMCTGFAMDLTKAVYVKQQYQIMGQDATTAAIRSIDADGSIQPDAAQIMVQTYLDRFAGIDSDSVNVGNTNNDATLEATGGGRGEQCDEVEVNNTVYTAPYIELTLDGGRNDVAGINGTADAVTWTYRPETGLVGGANYNPAVRYYALEAVIYDSAPNLMLGMFGVPCQQIVSQVSSVTFGSQEDLDDFTDTGEDGATCPTSGLRWATNTSLAWDPMAGATQYKLVTNNSDPNASGRVTSSTSLSGGDLNKTSVGNTWYLNIQRGTGAWQSCGSRASEGTPPPTCPTINAPQKLSTSGNTHQYRISWTPRSGSDHTIEYLWKNPPGGTNIGGASQGPESVGSFTFNVTASPGQKVQFLVNAIRNSSQVSCPVPAQAGEAAGSGIYTPVAASSVPAATCPTNPRSNLSSSDASSATYQVLWNTYSTNDSLIVTFTNTRTGTQIVRTGSPSGGGVFTSIPAQGGDTITFNIVARNSDGSDQKNCWSGSATVPGQPNPTCPSSLSISATRLNADEARINLSWSPVAPTDDVVIYNVSSQEWGGVAGGDRTESLSGITMNAFARGRTNFTVTFRVERPGGGPSVSCGSRQTTLN